MAKWEETVKPKVLIVPYGNEVDITAELEAQAEITWDIAEKAGIQKVVDWIKANKSYRSDFMTPGEYYFRIDESQYQAFLKECEK